MGKRILILGGTRFFGKKLANLLISQGDSLSIATRGLTVPNFNAPVEHLAFDRQDNQGMAAALKGRSWDVVFDQICGGPLEAAGSADVLNGCVGKYIFTSSIAVYDQHRHAGIIEDEFNPTSYPVRLERIEQLGYAEGKRLAEAVFHQRAPFPVASVRFPIVIGEDDYTRRLLDPVLDIIAGRPLQMSQDPHEMSLISSDEAANFLAWLGTNEIVAPINACSNGVITPQDIVQYIECITGRSAVVETCDKSIGFSVITHHDTWTINNGLAKRNGFQFSDLRDWLVPLIEVFKDSLNHYK